jgi:hypothetical protein
MENFHLGPTGEYPKGRLNKDDDGELAVGFSIHEGGRALIMNFGKPIEWFAMKEDELRGLIDLLKRKLVELEALP